MHTRCMSYEDYDKSFVYELLVDDRRLTRESVTSPGATTNDPSFDNKFSTRFILYLSIYLYIYLFCLPIYPPPIDRQAYIIHYISSSLACGSICMRAQVLCCLLLSPLILKVIVSLTRVARVES